MIISTKEGTGRTRHHHSQRSLEWDDKVPDSDGRASNSVCHRVCPLGSRGAVWFETQPLNLDVPVLGPYSTPCPSRYTDLQEPCCLLPWLQMLSVTNNMRQRVRGSGSLPDSLFSKMGSGYRIHAEPISPQTLVTTDYKFCSEKKEKETLYKC